MSYRVNMKQTFLFNDDLESAKFRAVSPSLRGHWLMLQSYCSRRANGGVVEGVRSWSRAMWAQILPGGGSKRIAAELVAAGLANWVGPMGEDLALWAYDLDGEDGYRAKCLAAIKGGLETERRRRVRDKQNSQEDQGEDGADGGGFASANGAAPAEERREGESCEGRMGREERGVNRGRRREPGDDDLPAAGGLVGKDRGPSESGLLRSPVSSDDAAVLFSELYRRHFGIAYRPSAADTMALRASWNDLEPGELSERMGTYLKGRDAEGVRITNFIPWCRGQGAARGATRA